MKAMDVIHNIKTIFHVKIIKYKIHIYIYKYVCIDVGNWSHFAYESFQKIYERYTHSPEKSI